MNREVDNTVLFSTRRDFLRQALTGMGAIALGSYLVVHTQGCSGSNPAAPEESATTGSGNQPTQLVVDLTKPENQALNTVGGTLALGGNAIDSKGILLYRESNETVRTFSRRCTHQGCTIGGFQNGVSSCPCHGSQFNTSGQRIAGPAQQALREYNAALSGTSVTITK